MHVARILLAAVVLTAGCRSGSGDVTRATGTLEYVEIDVAPLAPGRVARITKHEGESVIAGDTLAVLTQATVRPNIDAQQARVNTARARLRDLTAGPTATEIAQAQANLRAAEADADRAARDVERLAPLAERGNVSKQQLDMAQTAARTSAAKRDALRDALRTMQSGTRPEVIAAARSELDVAEAALRSASATQSDFVLTTPVAGTVVTRAAEPGEVVPAGVPAMTVADVTRPYVKVYVGEMTLPSLRVGDSVTAVLDAFPDRAFRGHIAAIAPKAEFTPRVALTREERADLLFAVRVEFVDPTGTLKAGLPVTVQFASAPRR